MTQLYDYLKGTLEYNTCETMTCSQIRAYNISQLCKRSDKSCFRNYLNKNLFEKEICAGK